MDVASDIKQSQMAGPGGGAPNLYQPDPNWGKIPQESQQRAAGTMGGTSQGYGIMPTSASPLSQAFSGMGSNLAAGSGGFNNPLGAQQARAQGDAANIAYQQNQQQFLYDMQNQQIQQQQAKTQTMQRLLALFGSTGAGAGLQNPSQGFLNMMTSGGGGLSTIAQNSPTLAGRLGQVDIAFNDTGGLRGLMQRLNASENRFADASSIGASRQGILDRNFGIARSNAFGGAFGDIINPMMQAAQTSTQGWMGGGLTPRLAAESLTNMAGRV